MRLYQKRFLVFFIILLILSLLALVYFYIQYQNPREIIGKIIPTAQAQEDEEYIDDFQVEVEIKKDSSVRVTESISYNFGDMQRHGIYRDIPYRYFARGGKFTVGLKVLSVTDENGEKYNYEVSRQAGEVSVKIGEADQYVTGLKTYRITYTLDRVINFFEDLDEFYWNVTGNNWQVPIDRSGIVIKLPSGIPASSLIAECFTGAEGSTGKNCQVTNLTNSQVGYSSFNTLEPYEGLTVVLGWPKGVLTKPNFFTQAGWILRDNPLLLLPLLTLLIMILLWYYHGRDLGSKRTIIPFYEPPRAMTPAEVGSLIDETVNLSDISSTFIDLAVRGYLKIKQLERKWGKGDWELVKLKDFNGLAAWEKEFAEYVFGNNQSVKVSDLKNKFYKHLPALKKNMYRELVAKDFFPTSPQKVRSTYIVFAFLLFILGIIVLPFFSGGFNIISLVASGIIIFWLGKYMPRKTEAGTKACQEIKGYRLYLSVAEKDRIKFHNAPEKTPAVFEKNLPYAMALGVEKKWAKEFENIYLAKPSWYEGHFAAFNAVVFVNFLHSFNSYSTATIAHRAAASGGSSGYGGGGFSGGGFGGGGGGSW